MAAITFLFDLAMKYQRQGDLDRAIQLYRQILDVDPAHAGANNNLGLALVGQGHLDQAMRCFQQAIQAHPNSASAHYNLGNVFLTQGQLDDAGECFRRTVRLIPSHADAHNNLGNVLFGLRKYAAAANCYREALRLHPEHAQAHYNLGNAFVQQGLHDNAATCFRQALRAKPDYADAQNNLGQTLMIQGHTAQAILCFQEALNLFPGHADAHNNLGNGHRALGQTAKAAQCYRQALQHNPQHAGAWSNLGNALKDQGLLAGAIDCYRQALRIDPHHADAHNNLGFALKDQGDLAEAAECYRQALALAPDHKIALWNRSHLRLLQGDFEGGWADYEQRWAQPGTVPRSFQQPRWDGSPLEGKTIFVYAEQGLGDTIQFIRHIRLVQERGGRVLFECPPALSRLLAGVAGIEKLVPQQTAGGNFVLPPSDVQIPLLSLPGIFGTTLDTIPGAVPYLRPDPQLVERWRGALSAVDGHKIGIVWQGNPNQPDDRFRSVPLAHFAPLAQVPGVRLLSLQVGPGREQLAGAAFPVIDLGSRFDPGSLDDVAAVLPNLDLVVTVCTSVAHLGGALGVPVWVALRHIPYWFWLLNRPDSPWYPTVRLFRQHAQGDWRDVFERMAAALRNGASNEQ